MRRQVEGVKHPQTGRHQRHSPPAPLQDAATVLQRLQKANNAMFDTLSTLPQKQRKSKKATAPNITSHLQLMRTGLSAASRAIAIRERMHAGVAQQLSDALKAHAELAPGRTRGPRTRRTQH